MLKKSLPYIGQFLIVVSAVMVANYLQRKLDESAAASGGKVVDMTADVTAEAVGQ